ncbi:hypothetical protein H9P43_002694 [Blastocladiella emersonii ATCC 22665]|nr:hypothetical protein H9P43_002694 [Blastocladiella emersonii ATCC 22665]
MATLDQVRNYSTSLTGLALQVSLTAFLSGACIVAFAYLRHSRTFKHLYDARSRLHEGAQCTTGNCCSCASNPHDPSHPNDPPQHSQSDAERRRPSSSAAATAQKPKDEACPRHPPPTFWALVKSVYRVPERDIVRELGLDAAVFLRFNRMCIQICAILCLTASIVLIPLHVSYTRPPDAISQDAASVLNSSRANSAASTTPLRALPATVISTNATAGGNSTNTTTPDGKIPLALIGALDTYSMLNLPPGASAFYFHAVFAYLVTAVIILLVYRNYLWYADALHAAMLDQARRDDVHMRTVLVKGIPLELRSEEALRAYFSQLRLGQVEAVVLNRRFGKLERRVDRCAMYLRQLEIAHMELARNYYKDRVQEAWRPTRLTSAALSPFGLAMQWIARHFLRLMAAIGRRIPGVGRGPPGATAAANNRRRRRRRPQRNTAFLSDRFNWHSQYFANEEDVLTSDSDEENSFPLPSERGSPDQSESSIDVNGDAAVVIDGQTLPPQPGCMPPPMNAAYASMRKDPATSTLAPVIVGLTSAFANPSPMPSREPSLFEFPVEDDPGVDSASAALPSRTHQQQQRTSWLQYPSLPAHRASMAWDRLLHPRNRRELDPYQPTHITPSGKVVKTIDYSLRKLLYHEYRVGHGRDIARVAERYKANPMAFVTFRSPVAAAICAQTLVMKSPTTRIVMAPEPRDIIWSAFAWSDSSRRSLAKFATNGVVGFLIFIWIIPISLVVALANLDQIIRIVYFLRPLYEQSTLFRSFLSSVLPSVTATLFNVLMPYLIMALLSMQGIYTKSRFDDSITRKYFAFLFINQLVFFVVGQTIITTTLNLFFFVPIELPGLARGGGGAASSFDNIVLLAAKSIPLGANFFINYILFQAVLHACELLQINWNIFVVLVQTSRWVARTPRDLFQARRPWSFTYFYFWCSNGLALVITTLYSLIHPLLACVGLFYFSFGYMVYKHNLLYCYVPAYETNGQTWHQAVGWTLLGLGLFQVTMAGLFATNGIYAGALMMLPLLGATLVFRSFLARTVRPRCRHVPVEALTRQAVEMNTVTPRASENDLARRLSAARIAGLQMMFQSQQSANRAAGAAAAAATRSTTVTIDDPSAASSATNSPSPLVPRDLTSPSPHPRPRRASSTESLASSRNTVECMSASLGADFNETRDPNPQTYYPPCLWAPLPSAMWLPADPLHAGRFDLARCLHVDAYCLSASAEDPAAERDVRRDFSATPPISEMGGGSGVGVERPKRFLRDIAGSLGRPTSPLASSTVSVTPAAAAGVKSPTALHFHHEVFIPDPSAAAPAGKPPSQPASTAARTPAPAAASLRSRDSGGSGALRMFAALGLGLSRPGSASGDVPLGEFRRGSEMTGSGAATPASEEAPSTASASVSGSDMALPILKPVAR